MEDGDAPFGFRGTPDDAPYRCDKCDVPHPQTRGLIERDGVLYAQYATISYTDPFHVYIDVVFAVGDGEAGEWGDAFGCDLRKFPGEAIPKYVPTGPTILVGERAIGRRVEPAEYADHPRLAEVHEVYFWLTHADSNVRATVSLQLMMPSVEEVKEYNKDEWRGIPWRKRPKPD